MSSQAVNSESPGPLVANVLGIGVHAVNVPSAIDVISSAIDRGHKGYVCVTGVHGIMEAHRDPEVRKALASAMLVVPDGMPTVWVGRWQGHRHMRRVFGPDLMLQFCDSSVAKGYRHFFYGGKPGVAEELASVLSERVPGLRVVGTDTPPFRALNREEKADLRRRLDEARPDIIWVGLSTPKQERFMADTIAELNCRAMVGVGAAFDFHTGRLKDSPHWIKNAGLQWLHRLCQEPSRLWKRYLINNSSFVAKLVLQAIGIHTYDLPSPAQSRVTE
jgi:N-acetylglucosaminyldiphosphoundecaprenol N-acetyl-beta-D-mannosaminyltransferase